MQLILSQIVVPLRNTYIPHANDVIQYIYNFYILPVQHDPVTLPEYTIHFSQHPVQSQAVFVWAYPNKTKNTNVHTYVPSYMIIRYIVSKHKAKTQITSCYTTYI